MLDAVGSDPGPRVFVVVPVHDRCDLTRACLDSLAVQTYVRRTIVVVDDGSTDGTPDMLSSDFPDAVVLNGDGNLWWAGATNLGVAWVLGHAEVRDLVLTMNNDSVAGLDYLARLVASSLEHPHALIGSVSAPDDAPDVITEGAVRFNRVTGPTSMAAQARALTSGGCTPPICSPVAAPSSRSSCSGRWDCTMPVGCLITEPTTSFPCGRRPPATNYLSTRAASSSARSR